MKKILCALTLIPLFIGGSLLAKTWPLRFEGDKVGSIEFPDSWSVNQSLEFIEGWSPDKTAHVVVSVVPTKSASASSSPHRIAPGGTDVEDTFAALDADHETDELLDGLAGDFKDDNVELDSGTKKAHGSQVGGTKGFSFQGKRDGKPLAAGTGVIPVPSARKAILFTYWCLNENEAQRRPEVASILASIKRANGSKS